MYNIITKTFSHRGFITLLALVISISLYAQNMIKGTVVDETDTPLIGATVMIKGNVGGTITDIDGNFSINASKGAIVTVSYIGYKTQEVKFTGQQKLTIKMVPDNQALDEVVVVGYGSMKRSDLTGAVASLASKDVEGFQSSSVIGALGGQIAGVQITQSDGGPGSGFNINIRGVGTMTGDASPLFIVDGFEVDNIDNIANSDIESMEFLKDASSSAIYGARAANGVVMITTKSGKVGKPTITYNGSASYRKITKMLDLLSPYEFVKLQGDIDSRYTDTYYKLGNDDDGIPHRYQTLDDYIGLGGVDWQNETFNPTWSQDHNLSITGGDEKTTYSLLFTRYNENGIFNNSGFDRTTAKFRIKQKLTKKISFDATVNYAQTNKRGVGTTADTGRFNMLAQILSARPTGGLKLTDEELASLDDEDIKVPLERYISVMSAGYFGGKAPTYKVKAFNEDKDKIIKELFNHETNDEQEIKEIELLIKHITDYNKDGSHFLHMVLDYLIKRACYEIYYKDETTGEITIARSDALETVAIWDYSLPKNLIGLYRIIRTYMANGEYQQMVELTTADGKRYYYDTPEKRKMFGTPAYEQKFKDEPLFKENEKEKSETQQGGKQC